MLKIIFSLMSSLITKDTTNSLLSGLVNSFTRNDVRSTVKTHVWKMGTALSRKNMLRRYKTTGTCTITDPSPGGLFSHYCNRSWNYYLGRICDSDHEQRGFGIFPGQFSGFGGPFRYLIVSVHHRLRVEAY